MIRFLTDMTQKTLRRLVFGKIALLAIIILALSGKIQFGDLDMFAADEEDEEQTEYDMTPDDEGYVAGDKKKKKKVSLLDKLFNIPKIDTKELKKDEMGRYLTILERKRKEIEDRIVSLREREQKLLSIEGSIDKKLKSLDDEKRFFTETIQREKDLKNERTKKLVAFYQKMTPKKAAPIFAKLDRDLVVELFNSMPNKQSLSILQFMDAEKSVELTEYFGRIRSGREYNVLKELNKSLRDEFQDCKTKPTPIAQK